LCNPCPVGYTTAEAGMTSCPDSIALFGNLTPETVTVISVVVTIFGLILVVAIIIGGILLYRRMNKPLMPNGVVELSRQSSSDVYRTIGSGFMNTGSGSSLSGIIERQNSARQLTLSHYGIIGSKNSIDLSFVSNSIRVEELDLASAEVLGKGAFGTVYKASYQGNFVAVKDLKAEGVSQAEIKGFVAEADLMRNLPPHQNVVQFIGLIAQPFCIITEYMAGGDLITYLEKNKNILMSIKTNWMKMISAGMNHLVLQGIVHRDLAARNVLLSQNLVAKVSDFGMSRLLNTSSVVYSQADVGPLMWMSPEALRKKKYSEKSDVWAYGVCCCEILTSGNIYGGMDAVQVATAVVSEGLKPTIPTISPPPLTAIISKCLEYEPENRPTFAELKNSFSSMRESTMRESMSREK